MTTMSSTQQNTLSIAPVDRKGRPAPVENIVWATSNSEVLTVEASSDGLSATVKAVGPLGSATVSVTCDGHIGEGDVTLAGSEEYTITAADAIALAVAAGEITEQA